MTILVIGDCTGHQSPVYQSPVTMSIMTKLTIPAYAKHVQSDENTIYRKIVAGDLKGELINGVLHVVVEPPEDAEEKDALLARLQDEVERLHKELEAINEQLALLQTELSEARQNHDTIIQQMQSDLESSRERSDVIILQLTQQLDRQTKLLEDMRHSHEQKKVGFFQKLLKRK